MIDPVTRWFEITQYKDKEAMTIVNLVETTWLLKYSQPVKMTYDRGGGFLGKIFKSRFVEQEYVIKIKPAL